MNKLALMVHGGASTNSPFLRKNEKAIREGLKEAVAIGYSILKKGGTALNAVERSVTFLEDHELFNAGKGSALNNKGEIEMDASIMEGRHLKAGAVSMVRNVKNPIGLARIVMSKTKHVLLSGYGAIDLAKAREIVLEPEEYFMTEHQYQAFLKYNQETSMKSMLKKKMYGTVGAVAVDKNGNLAAATSTGGTNNSLPGRIGDSCIIGAGCYANNKTCAVSGTGEGEKLIRGVVSHSISMLIELKNYSLQEACDEVVKKRNPKQHIGVIAVNPQGEIAFSYNTNILKCGWITSNHHHAEIRIFKKDYPQLF